MDATFLPNGEYGTAILIWLIGSVALMLWGIRMARTAVTRSFGGDLRRLLMVHANTRVRSAGIGLGVTTLLQSSTATCLLVASFVGRGLMSARNGLAAMLGADIGTTLVAVVISFNVALAVPILLFVGVATFLASTRRKIRNLGRLAIGLGLLILALRLILGNIAPLGESQLFLSVVEALSRDVPLAILFAAIVTWMAHSSLAVVLLIASFASAGLVSMEGAFALVLGANLGTPIAALTATWRDRSGGRMVAAGNIAMKLAGCSVAAFFVTPAVPFVLEYLPGSTAAILAFHCGFNVVLATVFLPFVGWVSLGLIRVLPDEVGGSAEPEAASLLVREDLDDPGRALGNAARETLRLGDEVARMLDETMVALKTDDEAIITQTKHRDDTIDALYEDIKTYLIEIRQVPLTENESRRSADIMAFTMNLEHLGDILVRNLLATASRKARKKLQFSQEGDAEIERIYKRVRANLQLALNVFISRDRDLARTLLREKEELRSVEREAIGSHLNRLEAGRPESIETSSLHLDVLRDLKRINSHLTSVAYPILIEADELRPTRLKKNKGSQNKGNHDDPRIGGSDRKGADPSEASPGSKNDGRTAEG